MGLYWDPTKIDADGFELIIDFDNLAAHWSFDGDLQELVTENYEKWNNDLWDLGKDDFCRYYNGIDISRHLLNFFNDAEIEKTLTGYGDFTDNSIDFPVHTGNIHKTEGGDHESNEAGSIIMELSGSNIELYRESASGSNYNAYSSFNIVNFNIPDYYFEGTVQENDVYVDRKVACYRRNNNELIDTDTSDGINGYRLETPYYEEHYIVCLDDNNEPDFNALIYDRVTPLAKE